MNLRTKRTICLLVGIAPILTIVSTISYAYFTALADLSPVEADLSSARVSVIFDDNDEGIGGELAFGESITKKFTIENTGTVETTVKMNWDNLVNTYLKGSLTYTLSYSTEENGTYVDLVTNQEVPRTPIPMVLTKMLADNITIPAGETYYYNLEITLNNLPDVDQTTDLKAKFYSHFKVENINVSHTPNFAELATTDEGVFEMEDDYGTSYYYRGAVENNYIQFANYYWRIIRVNGDGSLRIIYDGTVAHANGESNNDRFTSVGQPFNALYNDAKYVGWMYGPANVSVGKTTPSTSKEQAQTNAADSDIKKVVDTWYKTNIEDTGYNRYVSDTLFCNDRSIPEQITGGWNTGLGFGSNYTAYGALLRVGSSSSPNYNNQKPQFICLQQNDAFTVSDTEKGNGALEYPVGLITADEIVAAGTGKYEDKNNQYYLYKSDNYRIWSLSPDSFYGKTANIFSVYTNGISGDHNVDDTTGAVAPVINLTQEYANALIGDGTIDNPYHTE